MISTLSHRPELAVGEQLHIDRTDINFFNVDPEQVVIEITITNVGELPSQETVAVIQAAPLGAFVPWRSLTALRVPSLSPGESRTLRTRARRVRPTPLGKPSRVTPRQLLTALDQDDRRPLRPGELPVDLMALLSRGNPHFAGNLNVFVGQVEVERHMAQALRVYPGQVNMAMFVVGSRRDAYAFHLAGSGAGWDAVLYHGNSADRLDRVLDCSDPIEEDCWIELGGQGLMILTLCPPQECKEGSVEVHVTQRSTQKRAIVEFSLDPAAAGPGCYVV
jgi:hypothetical protein